MKSFIPYAEYSFIICQIIGIPPISTKGFGFKEVSRRTGYYKQSIGNVDAVILEKKIK